MEKDNKKLLPIVYIFMVGFPLYRAFDVWFAGSLKHYCITRSRNPRGIFCAWGPDLGAFIFGPDNAYLGYAMLMVFTALIMAGFICYLTRQPPKETR